MPKIFVKSSVVFKSVLLKYSHEFGISFASRIQQIGFHRTTLRECMTRVYPKTLLKAPMTKELHRTGCYCPLGSEELES